MGGEYIEKIGIVGIGTCFPKNKYIEKLLSLINIKILEIEREEDINIFTVGVCLPAAILFLDNIEQCEKEIEMLSKKYSLLINLFLWARSVIPIFSNKEDAQNYINRMITKGGITESVINSLKNKDSLSVAFEHGVNRCLEISSN